MGARISEYVCKVTLNSAVNSGSQMKLLSRYVILTLFFLVPFLDYLFSTIFRFFRWKLPCQFVRVTGRKIGFTEFKLKLRPGVIGYFSRKKTISIPRKVFLLISQLISLQKLLLLLLFNIT